jgi:PmbA protein
MPTSRSKNLRKDVRDCLDLARRATKSSGVKECEAFVCRSSTKSISVQPDGGRGLALTDESTLFIRVIRNGSMGLSYTNDLRPRSVNECIRIAVRLSSQRQRDEALIGFPSASGEYPRVGGLYDDDVAEMGFEEGNLMMDAMLDSVMNSGEGISVTGGEISASHSVLGVCNSSGIDTEEEFTRMDVACAAVHGKGRTVSPEYISTMFSRDKNLPVEKIGEICSKMAGYSTPRVRPRTEECEVVFSPMSLGERESGLLTNIMSRALSGMEVANGSTVFAGRLGEQVASDIFSMRDAPALSGKAGSRPFDDEGMPTANRWLIRRGVLKSFTWDSYYAGLHGCESTGSAIRDMSSGLVSPSPQLIEVSRGKGDLFDLVSEVDSGYLIWACQGAHTSSPETGSFSFVASPGLKIERGEVVGGVQGAMLSGNIVDLLQNVEKTGADLTDFGCSLMPSMLFRGVKVTTG